MKYCIINASHQDNSQSAKVGAYIQNYLKEQQNVTTADMIHLHQMPLPVWTNELWKESKIAMQVQPLLDRISQADAYILITPEYNGMATPLMKNFFLVAQGLAHKPAMIVSVSAGRSGSYPIAELRAFSHKNTHVLYVPEHIVVHNVNKVLNHQHMDESDKEDSYIKSRMQYALNQLMVYTKHMIQVREELVLDDKFPYGM